MASAAVMSRAATTLRRIHEGADTAKGDSFDAVREQAGELAPDLDKAATRYDDTGAVLTTYASALESAQLVIDPMIEQIETAQRRLEMARDAESDARGVVNDHKTQYAWEDDVSDGEKSLAKSELTAAVQAASTAESDLESLWGGFDRVFSTWSDAYDTAVDGIEDAFEAANNNDAWGEDWVEVLGWIAVGLSIAALFATGPIALALAVIGAAVGAAVLAINICKMVKGRGSWVDLTISIVSLIPFARPLIKGFSAGVAGLKGTSTLFGIGRGVLRGSIRSTLPRFAYRPFSLNPFKLAANGVRAVGNGFYNVVGFANFKGAMNAFRIKDFFIQRPFQNLFRGGHNQVVSFAKFVLTPGSGYGDEIVDWASSRPVLDQFPKLVDKVLGPIELAITWGANIDFGKSWFESKGR